MLTLLYDPNVYRENPVMKTLTLLWWGAHLGGKMYTLDDMLHPVLLCINQTVEANLVLLIRVFKLTICTTLMRGH